MEKIVIGILVAVFISLFFLDTYADFWGNSHCEKAGGNWVQMDMGRHCVDEDWKEIDIYKQ